MKLNIQNSVIALSISLASSVALAQEAPAPGTDVKVASIEQLPATDAGSQKDARAEAEAQRSELREMINEHKAASALTLVGF